MKQLPLLPVPNSRKKVYFLAGLLILVLIGISVYYYFSYQKISRLEKKLQEIETLSQDLQKRLEGLSQ